MEAEIPQAMYDTRMDEMVNDFAFRVEQQGLRLEDYLKYMGQSSGSVPRFLHAPG